MIVAHIAIFWIVLILWLRKELGANLILAVASSILTVFKNYHHTSLCICNQLDSKSRFQIPCLVLNFFSHLNFFLSTNQIWTFRKITSKKAHNHHFGVIFWGEFSSATTKKKKTSVPMAMFWFSNLSCPYHSTSGPSFFPINVIVKINVFSCYFKNIYHVFIYMIVFIPGIVIESLFTTCQNAPSLFSLWSSGWLCDGATSQRPT